MGQIFSRQLQRLIVQIRPHMEAHILHWYIIFRRLILPQDIAPHRQADYIGISRRYGCNIAVLGIGIHAAFVGKRYLLTVRIKYAELRTFKPVSLLVHLIELYSGFVVSRGEHHFLSGSGMAFYFYRVCRRIQGIAHGRRDLGYAVLTGSGYLHRNGTVLAGLDLRIEAAAPHGKFRIGQLFVLIVNIPFYNAQGIAALCVFHGNTYIRTNRSVLSLLRYVKRTLRIVPFVPLRGAALYRHIAAVGYAGFNGLAAAIGYQRINWIFPGRNPHSVYFKLRSEQGLAVFIGLLYRQRTGLRRIFHGYGVAPVRRDLEGYKLLVQFIALRSYRLLQIISAQRQRYRIGAAVPSGYRFVLYGILILIQHLKCRAVQGFAAIGVYLFNGKLLLHPGIGP